MLQRPKSWQSKVDLGCSLHRSVTANDMQHHHEVSMHVNVLCSVPSESRDGQVKGRMCESKEKKYLYLQTAVRRPIRLGDRDIAIDNR